MATGHSPPTGHNFIKVSSSSSSAYSPLTSQNGSTAIIVPSSSTAATQSQNAVEVVRSFYARINDHDLASLKPLIAENCVYEDLMFSHPFVGRQNGKGGNSILPEAAVFIG
ncbi:hypothetical protein CCACVL1_21378 [Corchorus capsularis]|uniref:SnoaL-like domain-containing protein n=1 Tax=Corchorus capsularis TaxID=210143 RepID=A0A1R3H657_COCAP|nr:hypothetical protein CCACVL1_21378 [Corchorus capsularis]